MKNHVKEDRENYIKELEYQLSMYEEIEKISSIMWFYADVDADIFYFPKYFTEIFAIEDNSLTFARFVEIIDPVQRRKFNRLVTSYSKNGFIDTELRIRAKNGCDFIWVHIILNKSEVREDGKSIAKGHFKFFTDQEVFATDNITTNLNLEQRYLNVSYLLQTLVDSPDTKEIISSALLDTLNEFNGNRIFIFEYDILTKVKTCKYNITKEYIKIDEPCNEYSNLFKDELFLSKLEENKSFILNYDDDVPCTPNYTDILNELGIKTLLLAPLSKGDNIRSYLGIDAKCSRYIWNKRDKHLIISIANIIGLWRSLKEIKKQARQGKEQYDILYKNIPIGFIRIKMIYDDNANPIDFLIVEANEAIEDILNVKYSDIVGKYRTQITGDISNYKTDYLDSAIKSQTVLKGVIDGSFNNSYLDYSIHPIEGNDLIIILQNNTKIIKARKLIEQSEKKLRLIFDSAPSGIVFFNRDGSLLDINHEAMKILGIEDKSGIINRLNLFNSPVPLGEHISRVIDDGNFSIEIPFDFEKIKAHNYYKTTRSGVADLSTRGTVLRYDDQESFLVTLIDVTESNNSLKKIKEFNIIFNTISEFSKIGLSLWNPLKQQLSATQQWFDNLDYGDSEIINIFDAHTNINEVDYQILTENLNKLISGEEKSFKSDIQIYGGKKAKWITSTYKISVFNPLENNIEIVGANIDITEQKEKELELENARTRAEEADKLKSSFLANMSHEIRTPLNAIVGFSEMISNSDDIDEKEQYSLIIRQNNELLLQLISDIFDISKLESEFMTVKLELVNISDLISEAMYANSIKITEGVELVFDKHNSGCILLTDKSRVLQIMNNLIGNAIKFTPKGSINIGFSNSSDRIKIYVKDSGIGIDKNKIDVIFDRFIKLNKHIQGTGLGLSICRNLAKKLKGEVYVTSEKDVGTCFTVELPYDKKYHMNYKITSSKPSKDYDREAFSITYNK